MEDESDGTYASISQFQPSPARFFSIFAREFARNVISQLFELW